MSKLFTCSVCKVEKTRDNFYNNKSYPWRDNASYQCKSCTKTYVKANVTGTIWNKETQKKNYTKHKESILYKSRQRWLRDKWETLKYYSAGFDKPTCNCCLSTDLQFLSIDHIYGNGASHRRIDPEATKIIRWLKKNNFPPGFQTLCMNCNFSFGKFGFCPHMLRGEGSWENVL